MRVGLAVCYDELWSVSGFDVSFDDDAGVGGKGHTLGGHQSDK